MRTRPAAALMAVLALVACKKSEDKKHTDEPDVVAKAADASLGSGTGTAVAPTIDAAAAATDTIAKPFFYKVTKDGKSAYFLGSIHIGVDPKRLPPAVWDAAKAAKTFAMEADASDQMKAATIMAMAMARTDGKTLEQDLGPEYWTKLDAAIGDMVPGGAKMLNGMKPAMPAAMIQVKGMPETPGIDLVFLADAQSRNEKLVFLEDLEKQAKIIAELFDTRFLKWELDHLDDLAKQRDELVAAYLTGDDAGVSGLDDASEDQLLEAGYTAEEIKKSEEALLYERNAAWVEPIEKLVAEGDAFVVVGAAHLLGDRSVLDLLAKKGYTVERITP